MAFVKTWVGNDGNDVEFVDPEKVSGYNIYMVASDCYMVRLYVAGATHILANDKREQMQGWGSMEAAQSAVDEWFRNARKVVAQENAKPPHRKPQVGDIYRIHDRYWVVNYIDVPSDSGVYSTYIALLMTKEERKPGGYNYTNTTSRMSTFFTPHAEYVGHISSHLEAARQLLGGFYREKGSLAYVLDGFTGREGMTVHYGLQGTNSTYCCAKKLPLEKGHVVTDNEHGVTCPQFDRSASYEPAPPKGVFAVVHYAHPEDNKPRCCDATYPLPEDQTWMADTRFVTCPGDKLEHFWCDSTENHDPHIYDLKGEHVVKPRTVRCDGWPNPHNTTSESIGRKPCGSTKGHAPHIWEDEEKGDVSCPGLTFPTFPDPVNSGDDA